MQTMLDKAPIFLNGFTRGGSDIIVNLMLSHPGVCAPSGETQRVFLGETGVVFTTDVFAKMYRHATFFGLVRNGLALCEGNQRRGRAPKDFARIYCRLVDEMLGAREKLERYRIVRFEDILQDPLGEADAIYHHAGLNFDMIDKIRLQLNPTMSRSGEHRLERGAAGELVWYTKQEALGHFRPDINAIQQDRLSAADRLPGDRRAHHEAARLSATAPDPTMGAGGASRRGI